MALAEVLAARAARKGRSASVECGELGTLVVEALPPRECAALLRGPGGGRALLYAACRDLQAQGEALRREGKLFRPGEIMDFVSEEEIAAALRTVLELSGLGGQSGAAGVPEAGAAGRADRIPEAGDGQRADGAAGLEPAPPSGPEAGELVRANSPAPPGGETSGWTGGDLSEVRPQTVQGFSEAVPEIRREAVREFSPERSLPAAAERLPAVGEAEKRFPEIRPETVRTEPVERPGQASREAGAGAASGLSGERSSGQKAQTMVGMSVDGPQNLESGADARNLSKGLVPGKTGNPAKGPLEAAHETRSEFVSAGREGPHEIKSEFAGSGRRRMHETMSDFPEGLHESGSEIREFGREAPHESESELAERVARRILEGLRAAAAVR